MTADVHTVVSDNVRHATIVQPPNASSVHQATHEVRDLDRLRP
eukprot:COSAG02_NODE_15575_length_1159_cov_1.092453_1_plen_42_part_10